MTYKRKTAFYGIPIKCVGDTIEESEEEKIVNIIENQLLAGTRGLRCVVFEDGEYDVVNNVDGTYTVMLSSTGERDAFEGLINGGYAFTKEPIVWQGLQHLKKYYLYLAFTPNLYADEGAFRTTAELTPYEVRIPNYLLLAVFDSTSGEPVLDAVPTGKIYSRDLANHLHDDTNPHGTIQSQDILKINKRLECNTELLYDVEGGGVLNALMARQIQTLYATSNGGCLSYEVEGAARILHVDVSERAKNGTPPSFDLKYGIAYHGDSAEIAVNAFKVYTNVSGKDIRITIFYE